MNQDETFDELRCVMNRRNGKQSQAEVGYVKDRQGVLLPFLVFKKILNTQPAYDAEKASYAAILTFSQQQKRHFPTPLGYDDEKRSLYINFASPTVLQSLKVSGMPREHKEGYKRQFADIVQLMYHHNIDWEYNLKNILVSHDTYSYQSDNETKESPLLIFIDFALPTHFAQHGTESLVAKFNSHLKILENT